MITTSSIGRLLLGDLPRNLGVRWVRNRHWLLLLLLTSVQKACGGGSSVRLSFLRHLVLNLIVCWWHHHASHVLLHTWYLVHRHVAHHEVLGRIGHGHHAWMEWVGLAAGHLQSVLGKGILLIAEHLSYRLLAWCDHFNTIGLAILRHLRSLFLNLPRCLLLLVVALEITGGQYFAVYWQSFHLGSCIS